MARTLSLPADLSPAPHRPESRQHRQRWGLLFVCGLAAAAVVGCGAQEEIRTYQVPREPNVRMLAAFLLHEKSVWFIKVAGPAPAIEQQKQAFKEFVQSFRIDLEKDPPATWNVPKGWKEEQDDRKRDRIATFRLGPKESGGLELTVTALPRRGQAASAVANVNRWRGQLGLSPITEAELAKLAEKVPVETTEKTLLVDMVGTGPHLVTQGFFVAPPAPVEEVPSARPVFTTPTAWQEAPLKPFSVATFRTGKDQGTAEVTVSKVGGGWVVNVNRWRAQVGLAEVGQEQLRKELRTLEVAGAKAPYAEYEGVYQGKGEFNGKPVKLLGVAVSHEGVDWYFKMTGPPNVVAQQRDAFEAFVRSVEFVKGKEQ